MADLSGQVVVVVGSSSGMGRAAARACAGAGAKVVLAARSAGELEALAAEIGDGALACPTDVTDPAQVDGLVAPLSTPSAASTCSSTPRGPTSPTAAFRYSPARPGTT